MAYLFEHQGKEWLRRQGIRVPDGRVAATPAEAEQAAVDLGGRVVVKAQAWVTSRAAYGGIKFAQSPAEARVAAESMLGAHLKGFHVSAVLVERALDLEGQFYMGIVLNDRERRPNLLFAAGGGSGIEDRMAAGADRIWSQSISPERGLTVFEARDLLRRAGVRGDLQKKLTDMALMLYRAAVRHECRSLEINPVGIDRDGNAWALDCRMAVDDHAVFRHPELGVEVAREFGRMPTRLETVAYKVEAKDHRGTFFFMQLEETRPGEGYVGFHGGGGGGSMMSMDALLRHGFKLANYCDTSGNPSAAKVYRAAKIILSQPHLVGYFCSGSGVASQEQVHTARGLIKAFREVNLAIPAVIRIGGNMEQEAIRLIQEQCRDLPGPVEAYGRDTSVDECARRLQQLIQARGGGVTGAV